VEEYIYAEYRYRALKRANPERAAMLLESIKKGVDKQYKEYKYLADRPF
jgi:pyruvate-ferredoxin/flavodoxin oxidoreductase